MKINALQKKHPWFEYRGFDINLSGHEIKVVFDFLLAPDVVFTPAVLLPAPSVHLPTQRLAELVFFLGLIECISYWKCACSPELRISCGALSATQQVWFKELLLNGLGEFLFVNDLSPEVVNGIQISANTSRARFSTDGAACGTSDLRGALVYASGGKDSSLALELIKNYGNRSAALTVNPSPATVRSIELANISTTFAIRRHIDPQLIQLNARDYLNGHTPFSAYLSFLGLVVAETQGYQYLVAANEHSANECNLKHQGMEVNHQYSKSFNYERDFRKFVSTELHSPVLYFSLLRPLFDLQISGLFAEYPQHLTSFRSCNVNQKIDSWCANCPKCCFVYLCLATFLVPHKVKSIFGKDILGDTETFPVIAQLSGLGTIKPLECVGTYQEAVLLLSEALRRRDEAGLPIQPTLANILQNGLEMHGIKHEDRAKAFNALLSNWNPENFLPVEFEELLRAPLSQMVSCN